MQTWPRFIIRIRFHPTLAEAMVSGETAGNTPVAIIDIPEIAAVPTGPDSVYVGLGQTRGPLPPGRYKEFKVDNGGTITLTAGLYTFTKFFLGVSAKVILDVNTSDMVDIQVQDSVEFSDYSKMQFADEGYIPFIRFYTNSAVMVRLGVGVIFTGVLVAPHGDIHVYTGTQCKGALYGKTIYVEPRAYVFSSDVANQCEDTDGDRISNIVEVLTGSNPDDRMSFVKMAIPSEWCIDNTQNVTVTYDFTPLEDYGFAPSMEATFPAGSLTRSYIPMLITARNAGELTVPPFSEPGYDPLGRYIDFLPENGLTSGATFTLHVPHEAVLSATTFIPYQYGDTSWVPVATGDIISSDATSDNITVRKTKPFFYAGLSRSATAGLSDKTLYFDGGYVYSSSMRAVARYTINCKYPDLVASTITKDSLKIFYTDLVTATPESVQVEFEQIDTPLREAHTTAGVLVRNSAFRIDSCKVFVYYSDRQCSVYKQPGGTMYTVNPGQALALQYNQPMGYLFNVPPSASIAISFSPGDVTFESAGFGNGRVVYNTTSGASSPYSYEYYLTDHLGSTRVAINDQGVPIEATMYQPYGTMSEVGNITTSALNVRDKFTTKEFDEEGPPMGRLEFEMVVDVERDSIDLDDTLYNAVSVFYTDFNTPPADAQYDVFLFDVDDAANEAVARGTITYSENRQIKWVHVVLGATAMLPDIIADVNCAINGVNKNVGPDSLVKISCSITAKSQLPNLPAFQTSSVLSIAPTVGYAMNGIGNFYFGRRYYDPEIGSFSSTDAAGQFVNAYSYCGGNPIGFVDPDGNFIAPTFSINKNGLSVGFTCGWWGLGGRMNWNGEFATGPYAELGPRFGPNGEFGLTLQGGTMYGTKSGLYQQGSVGFDFNRMVGVGASTTYNYGRNQFSDIMVSGNVFSGMAGISYNTGNGNVNYSIAPPAVGFGPSGNFSVGASFSWGDDGRQFDVSGGYYPRDHASYSPWDNGELDKLMQDLKGNKYGTKRESSDAKWPPSQELNKEKIMQTLSNFVPNTWWEVFVSMFNMHEGATWEKRLPGGFHFTVVEGKMTVHQDFYDVTSDPSKVVLHNLTEAKDTKKINS